MGVGGDAGKVGYRGTRTSGVPIGRARYIRVDTRLCALGGHGPLSVAADFFADVPCRALYMHTRTEYESASTTIDITFTTNN